VNRARRGRLIALRGAIQRPMGEDRGTLRSLAAPLPQFDSDSCQGRITGSDIPTHGAIPGPMLT
jgi:hypothetical protein